MAKTSRIEIRVTPDELEQIKWQAAQASVTVSEWVRMGAIRQRGMFIPPAGQPAPAAQDAINEQMAQKVAERPSAPPLISPALRPPIPKK